MGRPRNDPREVILRMSKRMPNGCLEWQGQTDKDGYGKVTIGGRYMRAHRVAYEAFRGPIPAGLVLDHVVCDNPPCVDWWHTEPRTSAQNTLRSESALAAVNARKKRCDNGHEFTLENTYEWRGMRFCRQCRRDADRRRGPRA